MKAYEPSGFLSTTEVGYHPPPLLFHLCPFPYLQFRRTPLFLRPGAPSLAPCLPLPLRLPEYRDLGLLRPCYRRPSSGQDGYCLRELRSRLAETNPRAPELRHPERLEGCRPSGCGGKRKDENRREVTETSSGFAL